MFISNSKFTSNSKSRLSRIAGVAVVALTMSLGSFTAQANDLIVQDTFRMLEQNISTASQDLILSAKQELLLSLKTQIAEQIFDSGINADNNVIATDVTERSVNTAASQK
ncbi:hypothetical protein [Shewanella sp. OMA3-2]|uniref:hypothetical protein n=1 Tax=Shewanella sp. OMA3-2 TaxID=2908650 RepID=UPI001F1628A7|nr:hypothetical protein [Shewanella sp. OMA3-2]UJF22751.1 hypothetical protein L0B17_05000 [Shewanella sp. OMA3-2]